MSSVRRPESYPLFEKKGKGSALRVRRLHHLVQLLHPGSSDWSHLKVLDVGCGEGLFSIECALQGASVLAVDARTERMDEGRKLAEELALSRLQFVQADLRTFSFEERGPFDLALALGLLYHFQLPDLIALLQRLAKASDALVIDTRVALSPSVSQVHEDESYPGWLYREHEEGEDTARREARWKASLGNLESFWPTQSALTRALQNAGFETVLEVLSPDLPFQGKDRVMLLAVKSRPSRIETYPWLSDCSDSRLVAELGDDSEVRFLPPFSLYEQTLQEVTTTLGLWCRKRKDMVLGSHFRDLRNRPVIAGASGDAAIWSRSSLEDYVGKLANIPPLLVVEIATAGESVKSLQANPARCIQSGVSTVWQIFPDSRLAVVQTAEMREEFFDGALLPEIPNLPDLQVRVCELLPQV